MNQLLNDMSERDLLIRVATQVEEIKINDIPDITKRLDKINGCVGDHEHRISTNEGKIKLIVYILLASGVIGGGIAGLFQVI